MPKIVLPMEDIPELPGYMTVAAVANKYGIHKNVVYYMIQVQVAFKTVFKVTKGGDGTQESADQRPLLLLATNEVEQVMAKRNETKNSTTESARSVADWNRRVRTWAKRSDWTLTPIHVSGPPQKAMADAYQEAHPEDRRPG